MGDGILKRLGLSVVLVLLVADGARADVPRTALPAPDDEPPPAPAPAGGADAGPEWYGWQIFAIDAAAGVGIAAAFHSPKAAGGPLLLGALLAFEVGGPVLHGTHRRRDAIPGSIVLRVVAPIVTIIAVYQIVEACDAGENGWHCPLSGATALTLAFAVPLTLASVIDAARASTRPAPPPPRPPPLAWTPTLAPTTVGAGATLGLVGRF